MWIETFKARKVHKCDGCGLSILPGTTYERIKNPPWLDYEGDVNDEGRPIAILREESERHWEVLKFHFECYDRFYYGGSGE